MKNPVTSSTGSSGSGGDCGQGNFDAEAEGIHLTFENTNWIHYDFDWTNQE